MLHYDLMIKSELKCISPRAGTSFYSKIQQVSSSQGKVVIESENEAHYCWELFIPTVFGLGKRTH